MPPPTSSSISGLKFVDTLTPPEAPVRLLDFVGESYASPPQQAYVRPVMMQGSQGVHPPAAVNFSPGLNPMYAELARLPLNQCSRMNLARGSPLRKHFPGTFRSSLHLSPPQMSFFWNIPLHVCQRNCMWSLRSFKKGQLRHE